MKSLENGAAAPISSTQRKVAGVRLSQPISISSAIADTVRIHS
jgi:hypothetical protein